MIGAMSNKYIDMQINSITMDRVQVHQYEYTVQSIFVKKGCVIRYIYGSALTDDDKSKIIVKFDYSNR